MHYNFKGCILSFKNSDQIGLNWNTSKTASGPLECLEILPSNYSNQNQDYYELPSLIIETRFGPQPSGLRNKSFTNQVEFHGS